MYRGVHKVYDYWFTGQNTEVLNFEIDANTNYLSPIGNSGINNVVQGDARYAEKRFFQTSAEESTQGGRGESTLPAAQLAARLYGPADVAKIDIEIVGDPDWIIQSELFYTKSNLGAFEPDGSVNVNASEVLFEIRFNRVVDYDSATGLTPVYKNNTNQSNITGETNLAEESLVFAAYEVTNYFKEGKFTQRLSGTLRNFDTAVNAPQNVAAQQNQVANTQLQTPVGINTVPTKVNGSQASTGARPAPSAQQSSTVTGPPNTQGTGIPAKRLDSAGVRQQFVDSEFEGLPPVPPKPGSNTQSDDAGRIRQLNNFAFSDDSA